MLYLGMLQRLFLLLPLLHVHGVSYVRVLALASAAHRHDVMTVVGGQQTSYSSAR
jgi:hypothetical protein